MATPESKVKDAYRSVTKERGGLTVNPIGGPYAQSGVSDHLTTWRGLTIAVEAKAEAPIPTASQLAFILQVRKVGGIAGCIGSRPITTRMNFGKEYPTLVGASFWLLMPYEPRYLTASYVSLDKIKRGVNYIYDQLEAINAMKHAGLENG